MAIASLVTGISGLLLGLCGCFFFVGFLLWIPTGIAAIITGVMGRRQAAERGAGGGLAIAGLILGIVQLVLAVVLLVLLVIGVAAVDWDNLGDPNYFDTDTTNDFDGGFGN